MGSDLLAGIAATSLVDGDAPSLLVDFGTNSEVALWAGSRLWVTSAAGGPAFEGCGIGCGAPAGPGAIAHVMECGSTFEFDVMGGVDPIGLCGTGLVDAIAALRRSDRLSEVGRFSQAVPTTGFTFTSRARNFRLTKKDVDVFQRAKAAQYLSGLTIEQDVWAESTRLMVQFLKASVAAVAARDEDGTPNLVQVAPADDESVTDALSCAKVREAVNDVFQGGFLCTTQLDEPDLLSLALFPVSHGNQVAGVLVAGYRVDEPWPRELLDVALAISRIIGSTATRLASEQRLREQGHHLEELVRKRTAQLAGANAALREEATRREADEKRIRRLNEMLRTISNVGQVIASEDDRDRLIQATCDELTAGLNATHAWIALVDEGARITAVAQSSNNKDGASALAAMTQAGSLPPCAIRALDSGEIIRIADPKRECPGCKLLNVYEGTGGMAVRMESEGCIHGVLTCAMSISCLADPDMHTLLRELANDVAFALGKIKTFQALAKQHAKRDRRVDLHFHRRCRSSSSSCTAENGLRSLTPRMLAKAPTGSVGGLMAGPAPLSGTRRATGRRWEFTTISSPCSTKRRYSLSFCLSVATLTVFMSTR